MIDLRPFSSADETLDAVLSCLSELIPFGLWMVTKVDQGEWTIVKSRDSCYGVAPGRVFDWQDTYCSRMSAGRGPMFAEVARSVPCYREAPINTELPLPIGAYIGVPITRAKGEIAGILCALDLSPQPRLTDQQRAVVTTLARALSTLLVVHTHAEAVARKAERHRNEAETDPLTGLYNRRGWDLALEQQELTTSRTMQEAMIVILDLDGLKPVNDRHGHRAGDDLLRLAGRVIAGQFRGNDLVARIGGDEFGVLVPGITRREARAMVQRLKTALSAAGVAVSLGIWFRLSSVSMWDAVKQADAEMYRHKAGKATAVRKS